jgi:hypothetical protein
LQLLSNGTGTLDLQNCREQQKPTFTNRQDTEMLEHFSTSSVGWFYGNDATDDDNLV